MSLGWAVSVAWSKCDVRLAQTITARPVGRGGALRPNDLSYNVRLRDISQHGCSLELVNRIPVGGRLWLRIPDLSPIAGVIRWEKHFLAGVDFETPLHPSVLDWLVRSQRG